MSLDMVMISVKKTHKRMLKTAIRIALSFDVLPRACSLQAVASCIILQYEALSLQMPVKYMSGERIPISLKNDGGSTKMTCNTTPVKIFGSMLFQMMGRIMLTKVVP
jgi:hypothetical protein